jgi:hypothetical protein
VLRTLTSADDRAIGELFDATLLLGTPLPFALARGAVYRTLCIGWYLGAGRADAAVVCDPRHDGEVVGYALVCTDEPSYRRAIRRATARFTLATFAALITCRLDHRSRQFYTDRLRDAVHLANNSQHRPTAAHAHLNVRSDRRSGSASLLLREHIDERCRLAGIAAWSGDINAPVGARRRALERLGLEVTASAPNHTLSRRLGRPVERLLVVRRVRPRAPGRSPRPHSTAPTPW